jgi:hypothetical protein
VFASQGALANADPASYQAQAAERNRLLTKYDHLCHEEDDLNRAIFDQQGSNSPDSGKELDHLVRDLKIKQGDLHKLELDIRDLDTAILVMPK